MKMKMKVSEFEIFLNNIACRRETNQHKARKYWNIIKSNIPTELKSEFETDWIHYLQGSLDTDRFCGLCVKPLEEYLK